MGKEKFDAKDYDMQVKRYIELSENNRHAIAMDNLSKYNLPDYRWFIKHCHSKNIKSWNDFVDWCGFYSRSSSKEKVIDLIMKKQESLNRPLMYDDFRNRGCYDIPFTYIYKTWGTINQMKIALGLEIIQEDMISKSPSKKDFDDMCDLLFQNAKDNGMNFITRKYVDSFDKSLNYEAMNKACKKYYHIAFSEYIINNGFRIGNAGRGCVYDFEDGERVSSQFEFMFSKFLRNNGLMYNVDYFRDVKYSSFIADYNDGMNCDYLIKLNDEWVYIEIAGLIEAYKDYYYLHKEITASKKKEKYRQKLEEKEKMLKNNNLKYFVLFPCDLTGDIFMSILTNPSIELKHQIEGFRKNNIDWDKIRENGGELKYSDEIKWGRNVVIYENAKEEMDGKKNSL